MVPTFHRHSRYVCRSGTWPGSPRYSGQAPFPRERIGALGLNSPVSLSTKHAFVAIYFRIAQRILLINFATFGIIFLEFGFAHEPLVCQFYSKMNSVK
jgi:hypothetical protein